MSKRFLVSMVVIFVLLSIVFGMMGIYLPQIDTVPLHVANGLMLVICLISYVLVNRKVADRPHAFVQGVLSASLLRLMVCMGAMLAYVMLNRERIHKPTLFMLMGVYAVYSATETIILSKTARKQ